MNSSEASPSGSSSDCKSSNTFGSDGNADGEIMLAENNPKRRAGRKKFRETRHPVYRGISRRNSGKWVCEVREPNTKTRVWLGTHPTAEMAARAHDVAVLAMRGRSACLNFADSPSRLPIPASNDIKDIQKAAAEAAEAFRPREDGEEIEEKKDSPESLFYVDEEEIFEMPDVLASMAEGLMISPPRSCNFADAVECGDDGSLWSFD